VRSEESSGNGEEAAPADAPDGCQARIRPGLSMHLFSASGEYRRHQREEGAVTGARANWPAELTDTRLWHPSLRVNRVLRVMLRTRWSAEVVAAVPVEFRRTLAR